MHMNMKTLKTPNHCILFNALHEWQKSVSYLIYPKETFLNMNFTCADWLVSCLVGNIKETFSHNRAQILSQIRNSILGFPVMV